MATDRLFFPIHFTQFVRSDRCLISSSYLEISNFYHGETVSTSLNDLNFSDIFDTFPHLVVAERFPDKSVSNKNPIGFQDRIFFYHFQIFLIIF